MPMIATVWTSQPLAQTTSQKSPMLNCHKNVDSEKVRGDQLFHSSVSRNMISTKNVQDLADRDVRLFGDAAQ